MVLKSLKIPILLTTFMFAYGESYRFLLFFPFSGRSHSILGEGYVRHLLDAGHEFCFSLKDVGISTRWSLEANDFVLKISNESVSGFEQTNVQFEVTYVTTDLVKDPPSRLQQIKVTSEHKLHVSQEMVMSMATRTGKGYLSPLLHIMLLGAKDSVMHQDVQDLLHDVNQQFDAVIVEWMFSEIYAGFSAVFDCPLIWSSTMIPQSLILHLVDGDLNPAYTAGNYLSRSIPPFPFWGRINEFYMLLYGNYCQWRMLSLEAEAYTAAFSAAVEKRGRVLPPYYDIKYNASLILGNSHVSTGDATPMPLNYIPIGGYHIDTPVTPLPENLQQLMDNSVNGVIFFSMGSLLTSSHLPEILKQSFMDMFHTLNYTIFWSLDEDLTNLPNNIHNVKWAPQQSILAHPNCVLFISHGGLLSVTEALHFGVPIIGLPVFGDQYNNINRAVAKGYAIRVSLGYDSPSKVKEAIGEILNNPRYRMKAKEMSFIYHDRPVPPSQEMVHWVEHVVKTGGARHLRSPGFLVPWYSKLFLDLAAIIILIMLFIFSLIRYAFYPLFIRFKLDKRKLKVN